MDEFEKAKIETLELAIHGVQAVNKSKKFWIDSKEQLEKMIADFKSRGILPHEFIPKFD